MKNAILCLIVLIIILSTLGCSAIKADDTIDSPMVKNLISSNFILQPAPCKSFFPNIKCDMYEYQKNGNLNQRMYINDDGSIVYFMFFNPSNLDINDQVITRDTLFSLLYSATVIDKVSDLTNNFCPPNKNVSCYTYGTIDGHYINFRLDTPYPLGTMQAPSDWKPTFAYYEIYIGPKGEGCKWC